MFENNYTILELEAMTPLMRMFRENLYEANERIKRKQALHPGILVHPDVVPHLVNSGYIIGRGSGRSSIDAHIQIAQARSLADYANYGNGNMYEGTVYFGIANEDIKAGDPVVATLSSEGYEIEAVSSSMPRGGVLGSRPEMMIIDDLEAMK